MSFISDVDDVIHTQRLQSVLSLPLVEAPSSGDSEPVVDLHIRLPQSLVENLERIARAYPTSRNALVRVFLVWMVKKWQGEQKAAAEAAKPAVERARARKLGANRNK